MNDERDRLLESAWAIITNVGGGDWRSQNESWRAAVGRWRTAYFELREKADDPRG